MSRSKRKPYYHHACCGRQPIKWAKQRMTQATRRWLNEQEDLKSGMWFKRRLHSWHWHPGDGKSYGGTGWYSSFNNEWNIPNPRLWRK